MTSSFKFDPNSTENEGRWRLINPKSFDKDINDKKKEFFWREKDKNYEGISYVVGKIEGKRFIQAIRFNKDIWSEEDAIEWWEENKNNYTKIWTKKDWDIWKKYEKIKLDKLASVKHPRSKALSVAKSLIEKLGLEYVTSRDVSIDFKFRKNIGIPVGSLRRGKKEVGDLDIIITKQLYKDEVKKTLNLLEIKGGEKRIDFIYKNIKINLFVFLDKHTFGAALVHSTGPYDYNIRIRKLVIKRGGKLSQNGLELDGEIINTPTERSLFKYLGINERKPNER